MRDGMLRRELKKRRPFNRPEEEVLLNLLRTNDQVQICFTRLFREHGLTPSQYNVLRILRGEGQPLPSLEIAERMVTVVPGITGLIDRLEAMGQVRRERSQEDRRIVYVSITDRGLEALARLEEPLAALQTRLVGHLNPSELAELNRLLEKLRQPEPIEPGAG